MKGLDYSWGRPGGAAIAAAGFEFCIRYVPYSGDGGKGLTLPELADLHEHGIAVGLVFESVAERARAGRTAGERDARQVSLALTALGWPADRPVYFAVDFEASYAQLPMVMEYLRGAASVLGIERTGVYGSYRVVREAAEQDAARWYWQTYAWSGGQVYERNHVYQYLNDQRLNGAAVDFNEGTKGDIGAWEAPSMARPETELLLHLATYIAGPASGAEFASVEEALAVLRPLTAQDVLPVVSLANLSNEVNRLIGAFEGHLLDQHPAGPVPEHEHEPGGVRRT
jgi:hypothetical protein